MCTREYAGEGDVPHLYFDFESSFPKGSHDGRSACRDGEPREEFLAEPGYFFLRIGI